MDHPQEVNEDDEEGVDDSKRLNEVYREIVLSVFKTIVEELQETVSNLSKKEQDILLNKLAFLDENEMSDAPEDVQQLFNGISKIAFSVSNVYGEEN